jgi:hypothetical protein
MQLVRLGTRRRQFVEALVFLAGLAFLVVSSSARSESAYVGYPSSIAVLAHSGATGENSDPGRPGQEMRANSWATGTNPAVNSVYLRILAENPKIKDHNVNLAHSSATVRDLVLMSKQVVGMTPKPELVLIQIMDADIACPATKRDYAAFRSTFLSALRVLARGAPQSSFFVVSQFGSPTTEWRTFTLAERKSFGGTGPCDYLNPIGKVVPKKLARLETIIHGYEAQLKAACKRVHQCRYDGGSFGRIVNKREFVSSDLNHFSVKGHAKAAAVAWAALKRAGLVPRTS